MQAAQDTIGEIQRAQRGAITATAAGIDMLVEKIRLVESLIDMEIAARALDAMKDDGKASLIIGANTLAQFVLSAQLPGNGFLLFAEKPSTQVTLESMDRTNYTLGQTSKRGVFYIKDLSGPYRLRLNLPGYRTMLQKLDIAKGRLNCLGFDKPVSLPLSQGADGPQ